eukprot:GHVR01115167.1.p1 GENE.GHVR01115167.1~~GHVR01115167.1.p1  ORF type:complete len:356 (+),score=23.11 GHVR01115167.1:718-1785(+)
MFSTVSPTVRMPDGNRYKIPQGMPSGVLVTALGNTLCHYVARSYAKYKKIASLSHKKIRKILGRMTDRELMLNPDKCSFARKFKDLEYLSRFPVRLASGDIGTMRKCWRTSVRMMNNKRSYEDTHVQEAYNLGKAIAHIENFYNLEIRTLIEHYVAKLNVTVALYDQSGRSARVQHILNTLGALPRTFPTHREVMHIYGTGSLVPQTTFYLMNHLWECGVEFGKASKCKETLYNISCENAALPPISENAVLRVRHLTAPLGRYLPFRGNAGMKASEAVRKLGVPELLLHDWAKTPPVAEDGDSMVAEMGIVDVGSHPGSAINALRLAFPLALITGISQKHVNDSKRDFCYKVSDK